MNVYFTTAVAAGRPAQGMVAFAASKRGVAAPSSFAYDGARRLFVHQRFTSALYFRGLEERRVFVRCDGHGMMEVEPITEHDVDDISALTITNFLEASSFSSMTLRERRTFIEINSAERLSRLIGDPRTIFAGLVRHPDSLRAVAYTIVRQGVHRVTQEIVAQGERLHVSPEYRGCGLGHRLYCLREQVVRLQGYSTIVSKVSGANESYFRQLGYARVPGTFKNRGLARRGLDTQFTYLEKSLSL